MKESSGFEAVCGDGAATLCRNGEAPYPARCHTANAYARAGFVSRATAGRYNPFETKMLEIANGITRRLRTPVVVALSQDATRSDGKADAIGQV